VLALLGGLSAAPVSASATVRTGADTDGTRFRLHATALTVRLPARLRQHATYRAQCGRWGAASRLRGTDRRRARKGARLLHFQLDKRVGDVAEWCQLKVLARDRTVIATAVAQLSPPPFASPPELVPGPGVREARTRSDDALQGEDGDASFLLDGRVLTFRLARPLDDDMLLFLGCFSTVEETRAGLRFAVLRAGARSLTVDLEFEAEPVARGCLAEPDGASDLAAADF
jgi:hypothetical protein